MAGQDGGFEMMSVRKQIREMGAAKADDLISTMMYDHEQAPRFPSRNIHTAASSTPKPALTRSESTPQPEKTSVTRFWRSKTIPEDTMAPPSLAIKQTHWKPTSTAVKCADQNCRTSFTSKLDRRRNCAMCGKVFCRNCTNYNRRLSANAQPDPLGQFQSVCRACFNHHDAFGGCRDWIREFSVSRRRRVDLINENEQKQQKLYLCSRRTQESKKRDMRKELERLVNGYKANQGGLKGFVSEMVIPNWQKSSQWATTGNASECHNCGVSFGIIKRKLHCCIGGQIFCSNCAADEFLLYLDDDDGETRWALNGKEGGPTKAPKKFRLLTICQNCSTELQAILQERMCAPPPSTFMDSLASLHSQLSQLQGKVESNLPNYKQLVESMDATDQSPKDRHPLRRLIKAQSDLSDAFSCLAVESQKLKQLMPETRTQEKLRRNVIVGTYRFYSDNMFSFRNLKNHLSELIPIKTLDIIQSMLSLQCMERIHVIIQQLTLEALHLETVFKFDDRFFAPIILISQNMDIEFKDFIDQRDNENWDTHNKVVSQFIHEEMKNKRNLIKINSDVLKCNHPQVIHYLVVSQCSSLIHECYRELQAKTIDREFKKVKESLYDACQKLDTILVSMNSIRQ